MSTGDPNRLPTTRAEMSQGPLSPAYRLITLALVALVTIIAFEAMAIATAMPRAAEELGAIRSYGLTFSVMLTGQLLGIVLAGVWSDQAGPVPALYAGQLLFAAGAAVCALATSFPLLLAGRAITGLGAGLVIVVLYVVIGRVYPAGLRPRVFTFVSAAWVLPSLVGAPLAGWLAASLTWRLVFWVVVPPALVTLAVVARQAPAIRHEGDRAGRDRHARAANRRTAALGALVALAAALVQVGTREQVPLLSWDTLLAAAGVAGLLTVTPRLLPPGTMRMARGIPSVVLSRFLLNAAFNGSLTFVPLMLTRERGASLEAAGIVLALGSLGWSAGSWLQGQHRMQGRRSGLVSLGGLFLTVGCLAMVLVTATGWPAWLFALAMVSAGVGMGLASTSLSVLLLDLAPLTQHGGASAALQLSDVLGSVAGIAAASALFAMLHTPGGDTGTYLLIWALLAAVAALVVVAGRRCTPPLPGQVSE